MSDMTKSRPSLGRSIGASISYRDRPAAMAFLQIAFGFEPAFVLTFEDGSLGHAEMSFGDGYVIIAGEWPDRGRVSPLAVGGRTTQALFVRLAEGIDAHYERARAAGAVIQAEPVSQPYGDRTYQAVDPEGHIWMFGQAVADAGGRGPLQTVSAPGGANG